MSHDLHSLHNKANESLVRNLSQCVLGMRGCPGDLSQAAEALATRPPVSTDAAPVADAGRDSGGCGGTQSVRGQA